MKKLLNAILAGLMATFSCNDLCRYGCASEQSKYNFGDLLKALAVVESNNDSQSIGDNGEAIGILQIHKCYVDDCNRILGYPAFSCSDRWVAEKSRQMVTVYLKHYGKGKSIEAMAAIHSAGPNGWKKLKNSKRIQQYVKKVMKVMENGKVETN